MSVLPVALITLLVSIVWQESSYIDTTKNHSLKCINFTPVFQLSVMADDSVEDLLDDESLAEKEFYLHTDGSQVSPLRHSATTGTLDSVYLEPSVIEEDVQDIITAIPDLVKGKI